MARVAPNLPRFKNHANICIYLIYMLCNQVNSVLRKIRSSSATGLRWKVTLHMRGVACGGCRRFSSSKPLLRIRWSSWSGGSESSPSTTLLGCFKWGGQHQNSHPTWGIFLSSSPPTGHIPVC
eukprot:5516316-Amphidinium_carterae.1